MEKKPMPNPTEAQRESPEFEAIWATIKSWDVNVPEFYDGYCGVTGSHVALILNALPPTVPVPLSAEQVEAAAKALEAAGWPQMNKRRTTEILAEVWGHTIEDSNG